MTKWIVALIIVIIIAVGGWFYWGDIKGMFGGGTPVDTEPTPVDPLAGWGTYASTTAGFNLRYAPGYTPNGQYTNTSVSASKPIAGVSFTIPASMATGTNLSSDTYVSVEQLPRANVCSGDIFVAANITAREIADGGVIYSVATTTGAAAGNRYEEAVWAIKGSSPCTAVRYMVHYSVLENYPEGSVRQYDAAALMAQFDQMRRTLQLTAATTVTP